MKTRIAFFGSAEFSVPIVDLLIRQFDVVAVITQPDKQKGRGKIVEISPVKQAAINYDIPFFQPDRLIADDVLPVVDTWDADVFVVAAYGKIFPGWLLDVPKHGCINVHASLLPRWRGASPIQAAIISGEKKTGVTIMLMDEGLDTGQILAQNEFPISPEDTYGSLSEKLSLLGAETLVETLPKFIRREISPVPQNDEGATFCGLIRKEDGRLDFTRSAEELERRIRAFHPWPGSFFEWNGKILKIHLVEISELKTLAPSERGMLGKYPAIGTASMDLVFRKVQVPGKKVISGADFLNGARDWIIN